MTELKNIMKNFRITEKDKLMFDFLVKNGVSVYDWLHDALEKKVFNIQI